MTDETADPVEQAKVLSEQVRVALLERLLDVVNDKDVSLTPEGIQALAETWATVMEKRGADDFVRSLKDRLGR